MGEAELRVNQSRQTALDEGTPSPEQEGEKICRQGLDNSGNIEALSSGIWWAVEQCFGAAKTVLGMNHYEIRKCSGWPHHMLIVYVGACVPMASQDLLGVKDPVLKVSQMQLLLEVLLPIRTYTIADILALVARFQQRKHTAYLSTENDERQRAK